MSTDDMEINIATSGLGLKEKHIHDIYCLSKTNTNSSNFVYNSSKQIYRILDAYCGDSHTKKPPLLVIGIPLTGKSSLLSNWFTLRRNKKNEIPTISRYSQDEFIFWHSVGSTRSSCYEVNLIHRLFNDLNEYFDLSREVPINSDRLRWVLPRLLQTASHKGRMVIIIIDGIDRLVPDDDNESLLSWLPLEPLSNVKIILSATVPLDSPLFRNKEGLGSDTTTRRASVDINPSDSWSRLGKLESKALIDTFEYECTQRSGIKLLRMLERRPLQVLRLRHLEKKQPERLLLSFIKKTVDIDSVPSSIDDNVSLGVSDADLVSNHHRKSRNDVDLLRSSPNEDIKRISGFLLFPCHLQALLSNRLGSNAYFMRLVLVFSYSFSRLRGCSIWPLWSQLTSTEDIPSLLDTIFQFIESPTLTETTSRTQETELELLRSCGGLETLIDVYPWLSSLQSLKEEFHTRSEDSSSQSTSSKSTTTTSLQVTARQTSASESKQGLGLQDLMRRASSAMVSPARNKLQVSANQVISTLFQMNSSGYCEITRLCLTVAQSDPSFENIDPAEVNISSNSPSAVNTNLSFLKHGLIQPFVKEEQTVEEKQGIDTNGKKKIDSAKSQKLTDWLNAALVDLMPSNLLSNTSKHDRSANTVADEIWKESVSYFGPALCFLYVSRHGLTENELFTLLIKHSGNTADNDVNIYSNRVHSRGSRSGIRQSKEATPSLSASASRQLPMEVTETLIKLLETVGLLHSKQFKILNLPPSDDSLRNAVYRKYVCPSGGPLVWHRKLISFFKTMHVCVRRCEELPWQSRRVLQWYELKNVLTNLSSFKQMVSCHLKTEFMDLWLLLSRGPMPVSHGDNNGNSNKNGSIDVGDTDDSNMAQEQSVHRLEQVVLSGYSHQTIRRQELTGFVAPFDIVQEMNASVERWKTSTHSNDDEIKSMLLLISDFLCEFSQRLGPGPLFLRPSIDLKYFTLLGVTTRDHVRNEPKQQSDYQIIDDDNAIEPTNNVVTLTASRSRANSSKLNNKGQGTNNLDESAGVNNQLHDTISEISGSFPSQNQIESHLLSYLRWIWIQLPWLALNKARCIGRKVLLDKQNALARSTDLRLNSSQVIAADESSLALRPFRVKSSDASIYEDQDDNFQVDEVQFPEPVGIIVSQKLLRRLAVSGILPDGFSTQKHTTVDKVSSQSGPTLASSACNSILDLNDVRAVSKSTSHSEIDLIGMNYASLITLETSQLAFATSNKRPVSRLIEYAGHGILACDMTKTNRFKYRRNIDEDEEANKGLLYAEHSEFHKNRHSLFPNVEDAVRDQFADSEGKDKYLYNTSAQILQLGGTTKCDDLNLYRRLNGLAEDDLMEEYNLINQSSLPMTKDEVLTSKHTAKFTRERLGQDNSAYQMKCKLQTLQQVQSRLKQKMNEYQRAQEASTMTMDCLQELQSKYQEVHKVVNDETLIKYGYLEILEVFEKNPANSQYHIAEIEQHVKLGEQQLHDLIRFRKKALEAKDHASRFKSYQLDTKIEYYLEARELLQSKRKKFLQKCDLSEEDVTEALMSIRSNARISSCDSSDCHHQYGKSDKDDDISKKYDTANLNQSGLIDWDNGSFRLIKDSFSKPTPSTKHNESHEIVPANINNKQLETSDAQTSHSSNASSGVFQTIKDRYGGHELFSSDQFIQEAILTLDGKAIKRLSDETSKESQRIIRKLKTEYLLQSTCSRDEDDFIQRINANETLNASLQNTLQSTDEMCGNIRREVDYLYRELNSLGTVCTKDEESAKESENDLDGLIPSTNSKRDFESSIIDSIKDDQVGDHSLTMQCNDAADQTNVSNANREESLTQKSRQLELVSNQLTRNQKKVMDARTGISHIVNGLHINSSLLCSLPRSTSPPTLATDADISTGLVWIEEKLVAINEAMVIDESSSANMQGKGYIQTIGAEEATVAQRQQKLAVQVQRMLKLDNPMVITARNNPMKETHTLSKDTMHDDVKKLAKVGSITEPLKQYSKMSNTLQPVSNNTQKIGDTITEQNKHFITNKNHILMRPPQERDNVFSDEMKKLHLRQDKEGQEEEALRREREALLNRPRNVHKFIDDALATPESRKLLRQAKRLSRHVKSPKAFSKYGITLDALLGNRASIKVPSSVPVVTNPTIGPASDMEDDSEELMSLKQVSRVDIDD